MFELSVWGSNLNWRAQIVKRESQRKILDALKKENLTFGQLLEEAKISRSTLSIHLKELIRNGRIERFYNTYQITQKAFAEVQIEGMIRYLGTVATHQIVRTKLNLPIEFDIYKEMENYLKEEPRTVSWKKLSDYLEKKYPLTI